MSEQAIGEATENIDGLMKQRHHVVHDEDKGFRVATAASIVAAQEASTRTVSALLAAVACVSLIVGGIGIMNIMLVSVTERTREIGLRLAIGARPRDIRTQFVIEAVALCTVAALSALRSALRLLPWWRTAPDGRWCSIPPRRRAPSSSPGWSACLFGYYPAKRAASLDPVAALRGD